MTELSLGKYDVTPVAAKSKRMSMMIWGPSGVGKTTLAATAPGPILYIGFDPDGSSSIAQFEDVHVVDLSGESKNVAMEFMKPDPFGVGAFLDAHDEFQTVIVDSITEAMNKALEYGVSKVNNASIEAPSLRGYGFRNTYIAQLVSNLLGVTGKRNKHCIFIAHEDAPQLNQDGAIVQITVMLGGKLVNGVPLKFSEVWYMYDHRGEKRINVRPARQRTPMKSRMFLADSKRLEFQWDFDADNLDRDKNANMTIAAWHRAWEENNWRKIEQPT